jgi:NitT/TauT family transport system substrate-binding protein
MLLPACRHTRCCRVQSQWPWELQNNPLDRVRYTPLSPYKKDFDFIVSMMIETGVLDRKIEFEEYVDTRFAEGARDQVAWPYQPAR